MYTEKVHDLLDLAILSYLASGDAPDVGAPGVAQLASTVFLAITSASASTIDYTWEMNIMHSIVTIDYICNQMPHAASCTTLIACATL